jgi:hypothetical protein
MYTFHEFFNSLRDRWRYFSACMGFLVDCSNYTGCDGDKRVDFPTNLFKCLDECVIFVGFVLNDSYGKSIMGIYM